jgi:hypothetical protein
MKHSFIAIFLFLSFAVSAQKIKVEEERSNLGGGKNPSFIVTIYEASEDDINSGWKSIMKGYNGKVTTKDDGHMADNVVIKELGNNTNDVYYKVEKVSDKEHKLIVAVNLGGAFMNSKDHSTQTEFYKKLMKDFASKSSKDAFADELKLATKALVKLQSNQKGLEKDQVDLKKEIENFKAKIKHDEEDIAKNTTDLGKAKTDIEGQQKVVDDLTKKKDSVN